MTEIGVLLVDDDPDVLATLTRALGAEPGIRIVGAANGPAEAAELAARLLPAVALIDVRMPGGGGAKAAADVLAFSPTTRVLALSSFDDRDAVLAMLAAGAGGYLVKGVSTREILDAIRSVSEGSTVLSESVAAGVVQELLHRLEGDGGPTDDPRVGLVRRALAPGSMFAAFQPIVHLVTEKVAMVEALARFEVDPRRGPDVWFADAHAVGLGVELELAAMRMAVEHLPLLPRGAALTLNVSPTTLLDDSFPEATQGWPWRRIVLELTEHAPVEDYELLGSALQGPRARGCRVAIDDAGAGFATFSHILKVAPDLIKLDLSLVRDIDSDRPKRALASAIISFADEIGLKIVAEGIETAAELRALRRLGVRLGQGYYIARPAPLVARPVPRGVRVRSA